MTITITIQGVDDFVWLMEATAAVDHQTVKQRFCRELALSEATCNLTLLLSSQQTAARGKQLTAEEGQAELVQPSSKLQATVAITLAFDIWNKFHITAKHGETFGRVMWPDSWEKLGFTAVDSLTEFMRLSPMEAAVRAQSHGKAVKPAAKRCTDFVDGLIGIAAPLEDITDTDCHAFIKAASVTAAQHDKLGKPSGKPQQCSRPAQLLRHILLLLKFTTLLACIKYHDEHTQVAQRAMTSALDSAIAEYKPFIGDDHPYDDPKDVALEQQAMLLLAEQVPVVVRHRLTCPSVKHHAGEHVLQLLSYLLPARRFPFKAGARLVQQGLLPALVAALDHFMCADMAIMVMCFLWARKLKGSQAQEAAAMLFRMQAPLRLCNFLCPPFHTADKDYPDIQGSALFEPKWVPDKLEMDKVMFAASLILKIHHHEGKDFGDFAVSLPTPTPARWAAITTAASQAMVMLHWCQYTYTLGEHSETKLFVRLVAQRLLLPHMPDLELDFQQLLRLCAITMLHKDDPFNTDTDDHQFLKAMVQRLGHDPHILKLPERHMQQEQHRLKGCPGCDQCCGPDWLWKTKTTATLLACYIHDAMSKTDKTVAGVVSNALYAALDDAEQCKHLLLNPHSMPWAYPNEDPHRCIVHAIKSLDRKSSRQLLTQLNGIACMARLCEVEWDDEAMETGHMGSPPRTWFKSVILMKGFEIAVNSFILAFQTKKPWTTEHCIALTRALHRCSLLQKHMPQEQSSMYHKQEAQLLKSVMKMLVQFEEVTTNLPLRMQLLTACLQFLQPCWIKAASLCSKDSLQVLPQALIDIAHKLPASHDPVVVSHYPQYASFGMPRAEGQLWSLRSLWLDSVMHILTDTNGCQLNFVKYTYTEVESWFTDLVFSTSGRDLFDEEADSAWELPLLNPVAYFNMFRWRNRLSLQKSPETRPELSTAMTMMAGLFKLVRRVMRVHQAVTIARCKHTYEAKQAAANLPPHEQFRAMWASTASVQHLEGVMAAAEESLEKALTVMTAIKEDETWGPLLHQVRTEWTQKVEELHDFEVCLTQDTATVPAMMVQLRAIFFPSSTQTVLQSTAAPSRATIIEEALAAEDEKAAAKKAKKEKQKARKQLQQQHAHRQTEQQQNEEAQKQLQQHHSKEEAKQQQEAQEEEARKQQQALEEQREQALLQQEMTATRLSQEQHNGEPHRQSNLQDHTSHHQQQQQQQQQQMHHGEQHQQGGSAQQWQGDAGQGMPDEAVGMSGVKGLTASDLSSSSEATGTALAENLSAVTAFEDRWPDMEAEPNNTNFLQELFCCPLTKGTMRDPVIAADGHSYERAALQQWLAQHSTSPVTGQLLQHKRIVDNVLIRNAISQHREEAIQTIPQ